MDIPENSEQQGADHITPLELSMQQCMDRSRQSSLGGIQPDQFAVAYAASLACCYTMAL